MVIFEQLIDHKYTYFQIPKHMRKLLVLPFILLLSNLKAQNGQTTRITVFTPNNGSNRPQEVANNRDSLAHIQHNYLKWNYFLLGRGVFMINYEFLITGNLTAEVGAGLTYRDFIFETIKGTEQEGGNSLWANDGTPAIHLTGSGGLRYYLGGFDNFNGVFVQADISYRDYSFPNSVSINAYGSNMVPGYTFLDEQFKIGFAHDAFFDDFTYETYIGVGIRNSVWNYYALDQSTGTTYIPTTLHTTYPQFLLGATIGYTF